MSSFDPIEQKLICRALRGTSARVDETAAAWAKALESAIPWIPAEDLCGWAGALERGLLAGFVDRLSQNDATGALNFYCDYWRRAFDVLVEDAASPSDVFDALRRAAEVRSVTVESQIRALVWRHDCELAEAIAAVRRLWLTCERRLSQAYAAAKRRLSARLERSIADQAERCRNTEMRWRQANEQLHESELRFRMALDEVRGEAVFVLDDDGRIAIWNKAGEEISGYSGAELIGKERSVLCIPEDIARGSPERELESARASGQFESEGWRTKHDGQRFWAHFTLTSLADRFGRRRGFVEVVRDLTPEAIRARQLHEEETKFRTIFAKSLEIAVIMRFEDGRYIDANDAALAAYGFSREEVIGHTPIEIDVLANPAQFASMVDLLQRDGEIKNFELLTKRRNGALLPVLLSASALEIGGMRCCLVTARDVTEFKRAEEERSRARDAALRASWLKSEFVALVSHELRTPLNVLLGSFELAMDIMGAGDAAALAEVVEPAKRAAERLVDTVNHILELSQLDSDNYEIAPEPINLRKAAEAALQQALDPLERKGLRLSVRDDAPGATMVFDRTCLCKAIGNLLSNAIKFTPCGEVEIRIYQDVEGRTCLDVRDSGIGIEPSYFPHLFQPFSQASSGLTRRYQGAGLGLALAKRYAELNRAKIAVTSEPGKGSVFTIQQKVTALSVAAS